MRNLLVWAGGALLAALVACSPALDWRLARLEAPAAELLLPCKPDQVERSVPLGGEPTELTVAGCETGGATFAVMVAKLPPGRLPDPLLAGWQQATLANMRAGEPVARQPFHPSSQRVVRRQSPAIPA